MAAAMQVQQPECLQCPTDDAADSLAKETIAAEQACQNLECKQTSSECSHKAAGMVHLKSHQQLDEPAGRLVSRLTKWIAVAVVCVGLSCGALFWSKYGTDAANAIWGRASDAADTTTSDRDNDVGCPVGALMPRGNEFRTSCTTSLVSGSLDVSK